MFTLSSFICTCSLRHVHSKASSQQRVIKGAWVCSHSSEFEAPTIPKYTEYFFSCKDSFYTKIAPSIDSESLKFNFLTFNQLYI